MQEASLLTARPESRNQALAVRLGALDRVLARIPGSLDSRSLPDVGWRGPVKTVPRGARWPPGERNDRLNNSSTLGPGSVASGGQLAGGRLDGSCVPGGAVLRIVVIIALGIGLLAVSPRQALAVTYVPQTTYTSNTTWTDAADPYVLNGNVTVQSGVALTIEPGVVVKLAGSFRSITINGSLNAQGTASNRIAITSIQDDSIAGDTGGDGLTTGARGQWRNLRISGDSTLSWVRVRYGGNNCCGVDRQYGAIEVRGSGTEVEIDHSTVEHNDHSGIQVWGHEANVNSSWIHDNALGIAILGYTNEQLHLGQGSIVEDNDGDGVSFWQGSTYTGPPSTIMDSDIARNGRYGIYNYDAPELASAPRGNRNNIYDNGPSESNGIYKQLSISKKRRELDWTDNFWGDDVAFLANPPGCEFAGENSFGRLRFEQDTTAPPYGPEGPVSWSNYYFGSGSNPTWCGYEQVDVLPFSAAYIQHDEGPEGAQADLLDRHIPVWAFDAGENIYPQDAGAFTNNWVSEGGSYVLDNDHVNTLRNASGDVLAAAGSPGPPSFPPGLDLAVLGSTYSFGPESATSDYIDARGSDPAVYEADSATQRDLGFDEVTYERAARGTDGRLWLQYWVFYYYNSYSTVGYGVHEGDWEMIQVGLGREGAPEIVTFAAHGDDHAHACEWDEIDHFFGDENLPIAYVAARSHAAYPHPGATDLVPWIATDQHWGTGDWMIFPPQNVTANAGWPTWPGTWGASLTGEFQSPRNPSMQAMWIDPAGFHAAAPPC
jgi:hypothetical protein